MIKGHPKLKLFVLLLLLIGGSSTSVLMTGGGNFTHNIAHISKAHQNSETQLFFFQPLLDNENEDDEFFNIQNDLTNFSFGNLDFQNHNKLNLFDSHSTIVKRHLWRFNNNFRI